MKKSKNAVNIPVNDTPTKSDVIVVPKKLELQSVENNEPQTYRQSSRLGETPRSEEYDEDLRVITRNEQTTVEHDLRKKSKRNRRKHKNIPSNPSTLEVSNEQKEKDSIR